MSKKIVLENHFHNTSVTLHAELGEALSVSQVKRARRELCGMSGCSCGGAERRDGPFVMEQVGTNSFAVFPKDVDSVPGGKIVFDTNGDSQVFKIGEDEVFFRQCKDDIVVAYASDGDVYGYTNQYISFETVERAEQFLERAQQEGQCPQGWEGDAGW